MHRKIIDFVLYQPIYQVYSHLIFLVYNNTVINNKLLWWLLSNIYLLFPFVFVCFVISLARPQQ